MKDKGNFIFGIVVGIFCTLIAFFILPSIFYGFKDKEKIAVGEVIFTLSGRKPQETGFLPINNYPNVTMIYRYANGDILFRMTSGALIWLHMDPENRKCYGAPLDIIPAECRGSNR